MKKRALKKQKVKLTDEQKKKKKEDQAKKRKATAFRRKIRNTFVDAGFEYLNTTGFDMTIGHRTVEVDAVCFYENILLVCEDTTRTSDKKEHIRSKAEAFSEIANNFDVFILRLSEKYVDFAEKLNRYPHDRYIKYFLYFSANELGLTSADLSLYSNLKFIEPRTLDYFSWISQCIKLSAKYEIFRYLGITGGQIGPVDSGDSSKAIKAPIIYPKSITGLHKVRVVSFMMCAEDLLKSCYVLRKDNWEESTELYQRMIMKAKIKSIRDFLSKKSESFFNNIIVVLPDNIYFIDGSEKPKLIEEISDFESCKIVLPNELHSICIIDGQHRVFAHYEGLETDKNEAIIASLRKQLHLLVTGLIFPEDMPLLERIQIQSEIFLDINTNAKSVSPDVLLHIQMVKDPLSDIAIARRVIEKLNKEEVFLNKFALSTLDEGKIKTASIIKFALRYLVTITPADGRTSLYMYWDGDKNAIERKDEQALDKYIEFCKKNLRTFFSAVKKNNSEAWQNDDSKLLSTIAINGFIIAYNRQLSVNGTREFEFYDEKLASFSLDYSKKEFIYTSSQYRKFSDQILSKAFGLDASAI